MENLTTRGRTRLPIPATPGRPRSSSRRRLHIALVCSAGGHLTELRALQSAWNGSSHFWITYESERTTSMPRAYRMRNIGFNPMLMLIAFIRTAVIFARERPTVIISNGAEIALPAVLFGRLLGCRIIFLEVWTRVRLPTITGRLVYPLCDAFIVMWPEMLEAYGPKAQYEGGML